ncbi:MAG: hypothetical protein Q9168_006430 [Polycauliona sp. 1 TL-2023]
MNTWNEEWFAEMASDPDMPTPEEVNAIKEFMDEQTTVDAAAKRCTSRIYLEEKPDPGQLWSLLEYLAVEFPDTQDKIVELLAAIKRLPDPIRHNREYRISGEKTFSDLAYFRAQFGDSFRAIQVADPDGFRPGSKVSILFSWARINAFSARLTTKLVEDLRRWAVETIEDALDQKNLTESRSREFFLPAAANQIIFGSYPLWNLRNDPEVKDHEFAVDWLRWKKAFEGLAEDTEVSQETRNLLRQAVTAMEAVAQDPERDAWHGRLEQYLAQYKASLDAAKGS